MEVIYGLLPLMLFLGVVALGVFFWAARSGQFEDLEGEANRILMDDDLPPAGKSSAQQGVAEGKESREGTE